MENKHENWFDKNIMVILLVIVWFLGFMAMAIHKNSARDNFLSNYSDPDQETLRYPR